MPRKKSEKTLAKEKAKKLRKELREKSRKIKAEKKEERSRMKEIREMRKYAPKKKANNWARAIKLAGLKPPLKKGTQGYREVKAIYESLKKER